MSDTQIYMHLLTFFTLLHVFTQTFFKLYIICLYKNVQDSRCGVTVQTINIGLLHGS